MNFKAIPIDDIMVIREIVQILLARAETQGIQILNNEWWEALFQRLQIDELNRDSTVLRVFDTLIKADLAEPREDDAAAAVSVAAVAGGAGTNASSSSNVERESRYSIFNYVPYDHTVNYVVYDIRKMDELMNDPKVFEVYKKRLDLFRSLFVAEEMNSEALLTMHFSGGGFHRIKKMTLHNRRKARSSRHRKTHGKRKTVRRRAN
jgi:hypothetical protein